MQIDVELKQLLALEIRSMTEGWNQSVIAAMMRIRQPHISALRRGQVTGFSVGRLLRMIARRGYDIEVHLRPTNRNIRSAGRATAPKVSVSRYDRFGRLLEMSDSR